MSLKEVEEKLREIEHAASETEKYTDLLIMLAKTLSAAKDICEYAVIAHKHADPEAEPEQREKLQDMEEALHLMEWDANWMAVEQKRKE